MDVFIEQIVVKRGTPIDLLKKIGIVIAALVVGFIAMFILPSLSGTIGDIFGTFGLFLLAGALYGAYILIAGMNVEYEYILTNGEIDIDKIIAKSRRKRLITVNIREFSEFGLYDCEKKYGEYKSTIMACTDIRDPQNHYAVLDHSKFGKTFLIFTPNEKILSNTKQFIRRNAIK